MNTSSPQDNPKNAKPVDKAVKKYLHNIEDTPVAFQEERVSYSSFLDNKMMIIQAIKNGLSYDFFSKIKMITPFSDDEWAAYLGLSKKSLQRYQKEKNFFFKSIHSEKIIELAEVTNLGKKVFDSKEKFHLWLDTPCYALNNLKPAELLKNSYGKEMVMAELNRIDHGIFV